MSLHAIVAALGGDLYQGGSRASIPAPGHSAADRSASLLLSGDRVVIHGFGGTDWRVVLADLVRRGFLDRDGRLAGASGRTDPPRPDRRQRSATALRLWDAAKPLRDDDLAVRHMRLRGVEAAGTWFDLRFHPCAPLSVYGAETGGGGAVRPALVAGIRDGNEEIVGVEMTYLDQNGRRATGLRTPRKTVGCVPAGAAIRLCAPSGSMLVGEGLFSVMAAAARFGLPGWALMSAGNLARWDPPAGVTHVLIAGDRGKTGEGAAKTLRDRLDRLGVAVKVATPPPPFGDWDEARSVGKGKEEGRPGASDGRG